MNKSMRKRRESKAGWWKHQLPKFTKKTQKKSQHKGGFASEEKSKKELKTNQEAHQRPRETVRNYESRVPREEKFARERGRRNETVQGKKQQKALKKEVKVFGGEDQNSQG